MEFIQPTWQSQIVGQVPMVTPAPGKRLLLVDPYPRNNPYRLSASERRAAWFPKLSLQGFSLAGHERLKEDSPDE